MSTPLEKASVPSTSPSDLDALQSAVSDAIAALVAWDITAFEAATDRQRAICDGLANHPEWRQLPGTPAAVRKLKELNRSYDLLLQHSIHWTRTIHSIFEACGHSLQNRASMHFRG